MGMIMIIGIREIHKLVAYVDKLMKYGDGELFGRKILITNKFVGRSSNDRSS